MTGNRPSREIAELQRVVASNPGNSDALWSLAAAYARCGNWTSALETYLRAAETDPDNAILLNDIGIAYDELGDPTKAEVYYLQAITLQPDLADAYFNLGALYEDRGRTAEAQRVFLVSERLSGEPSDREAPAPQTEPPTKVAPFTGRIGSTIYWVIAGVVLIAADSAFDFEILGIRIPFVLTIAGVGVILMALLGDFSRE